MCVCVGHNCQPCKNGWTDQDAICNAHSWRPNKLHIRWGPGFPKGRGNFGGRGHCLVLTLLWAIVRSHCYAQQNQPAIHSTPHRLASSVVWSNAMCWLDDHSTSWLWNVKELQHGNAFWAIFSISATTFSFPILLPVHLLDPKWTAHQKHCTLALAIPAFWCHLHPGSKMEAKTTASSSSDLMLRLFAPSFLLKSAFLAVYQQALGYFTLERSHCNDTSQRENC